MALAAYNAGPDNLELGYKFADDVIKILREAGPLFINIGGDSNG